MLARAERQAEIEDHGQTALQVVDRHPLRNDEQALTHWQGAVVLLPGIGPVLIRDAVERQRQRAEFTGRIAAGQLREQGAQLCKLSLRSLLRQVQAHLRQVAHPRGKLFIHIIPIGARAVEELAELFAVIDDEAVKPGLRQLGAQKIDAAGCRSDGHFKPLFHVHPSINTNYFSLFYRIPSGITSEIFLRLFHFREKRV